MHYQQGSQREQVFMTSLEQLVAEDSFARIIDLFVDAMPIEELGFKHAKLNKEGNTPYHPRDIFKLLLYAYRNGFRSSSKIAKACLINVEVMWLMKGMRPSARTVNYFRSQNTKAIESANRHFVKLLKQWKLVDGKTIAVDGTKVRGQNSYKNNFNAKKVQRHIDYLDKKMGDYLNQETSINQNLKGKKKVEALKTLHDKMDNLVSREQRFEDIQDQCTESQDGQVSLTDPDAKAVILHRNIVHVGYNIQTTVDSQNNMIIDQFCGGITDRNDLGIAVKRTQSIIDKKQFDLLADGGYHNGAEIAYVERLGVKPFISPPRKRLQKQEGYNKQDFIFNKSDNTYICPQGNTMTPLLKFKRGVKRRYTVTRYATDQCSSCPVRNICTNNKLGRFIERPSHQDHVDRNTNRITKNKDYYRRRQAIVEHPFGTLKRQWHMDHTLLHGKENVITEYRIAALAYNLCRSLSILGGDELIARLKALILTIFDSFYTQILHRSLQLRFIDIQIIKHHIYSRSQNA
ncbi:MAG: IS1182 family transposase [Gammaproteobacteria bacterium]|nr:IS1182 family transposase [Gammaproteobacteria bacterium]